MKIEINLEKKYNIFIEKDINYEFYISQIFKNKNIFIITDEIVRSLYLDNLLSNLKEYNINVITIESSEKNKTLTTYEKIINKLIDFNITRDSLIIGFGGGVVGDIASFVSSTILRGVKYVSIPTTLLSQVDSSIGGKTGLNFNNKKNIIGTFYQPDLVLINPMLLNTLSKEEFNNGLGEVIKCGFIGNKEILSLLRGNLDINSIIYESLLVKKHYVEIDQFDKSDRMILNFGHTFGHVIELERNIKHGLAVIEGMIQVIKYGIDLNITNKSCLDELYSLLNKLEIKYLNLDYKEYLTKITHDKKNSENENNFIFIKEIENPIIKKIKRI